MENQKEINDLRKAEFDVIKEYINYDKLVDDLIQEKKRQVQKHAIEILERKQSIKYLENDIQRIIKEQQNSSVDYPHIFINPNTVYYNMTHPKNG